MVAEEEALERERELIETFQAVSPEEQEKILERFPAIKPLVERALGIPLAPEEPVDVVEEKTERTYVPKITPLSPRDRKVLKAIRGTLPESEIPAEVRPKLAELKKIPLEKQYETIEFLFGKDVAKRWGIYRKVESPAEKTMIEEAEAKSEGVPPPRLVREPLKITSEKIPGGTEYTLLKCTNRQTFHKDAAGKVIPEEDRHCYKANRTIFDSEFDCIKKIQDDNKVVRRHLDRATQTVVTEEVTPISKKILSAFLCTPEQGLNASLVHAILDSKTSLKRDTVKATLEDLTKTNTEITGFRGDKIKWPVISSPSECMTVLPELGPAKHICGQKLLGEVRYVMDSRVREKLSGALPDELISRLERWWEKEPVRL